MILPNIWKNKFMFQTTKQLNVPNFSCQISHPECSPLAHRHVAQRQIGSPQLGVGDDALHVAAFGLAAAHGHLEAWWMVGWQMDINGVQYNMNKKGHGGPVRPVHSSFPHFIPCRKLAHAQLPKNSLFPYPPTTIHPPAIACHISPRFQRGEDDVAPGGVHGIVRNLRQIRVQGDGAHVRAALFGVARVHSGLGPRMDLGGCCGGGKKWRFGLNQFWKCQTLVVQNSRGSERSQWPKNAFDILFETNLEEKVNATHRHPLRYLDGSMGSMPYWRPLQKSIHLLSFRLPVVQKRWSFLLTNQWGKDTPGRQVAINGSKNSLKTSYDSASPGSSCGPADLHRMQKNFLDVAAVTLSHFQENTWNCSEKNSKGCWLHS